MSDSLDPRVAELLSALLDGAVTPEERVIAEQWLERSPAAQAEHRSLHQVKAVLGGLGEAEVPFGFYERMLQQGTPTPVVTSALDRRRRSRGRIGVVVGSIAASAAGFVLLAGTSAPGTTVDPAVAAVASGRADGVTGLRGGDLGGVRVLRQEGDDVDWDALPRGERLDRSGYEIWRDLTTDDGEERVVVARGGVVVTVTGEGQDAEALIDLGRDVVRERPADEDDGLVDRVRDACENLVRSLSLG